MPIHTGAELDARYTRLKVKKVRVSQSSENTKNTVPQRIGIYSRKSEIRSIQSSMQTALAKTRHYVVKVILCDVMKTGMSCVSSSPSIEVGWNCMARKRYFYWCTSTAA
jgi:hypothetical protein